MSSDKRRSGPVSLSAGQAQYVLERLAKERVVSGAEIARYISDMPREIAELEARLSKLREAAGDGTPPRTGSTLRPRRAAQRPSAARGNEAKRLGGRFAGLIRRLPETERRQYHDIKSTKGVEAAIRALQERRK